jgi:hypothetical protein
MLSSRYPFSHAAKVFLTYLVEAPYCGKSIISIMSAKVINYFFTFVFYAIKMDVDEESSRNDHDRTAAGGC